MDKDSTPITESYLTELFQSYSKKSEVFEESFELIKKISEGKVWLMGSFLYGNLTKLQYDNLDITKQFYRDIDFIVERLKKDINVKDIAKGWEIHFTSYGSTSFVKSGRSVDLNCLLNFLPATISKLQNPGISDILDYAPLTIQSFAYDCDEKEIVSKQSGISALEKKIIRINNELGAVLGSYRKLREENKNDALYKPTEEEIINKINSFLEIKAKELNFKHEKYAPAPGSFSKLFESITER